MIITKMQGEAINAIDFTRTDGGLGVCFDGTNYICQDIRRDPVYSDYWDILGGPLNDAQFLQQKKDEAHEARRKERTRREATTYPHDGHRYDCDVRSAQRWALVFPMAVTAMLTSGPGSVVMQSGWRDIEGTPRLFTAAEILSAQQSLLAFGATCDAVSQVIAAEIDAAETEEAVDTLLGQIPTDPRWPADS